MSVKEFFKCSFALADEIRALTLAAEKAYDTYFSAVKIHDEDTGGGEVYVSYLCLKAELAACVSRLMEHNKDILRLISEIESPLCRMVLENRYINRMTFEEIAEETHYDQRHIYRLHNKAVDEAEKVLPKITGRISLIGSIQPKK